MPFRIDARPQGLPALAPAAGEDDPVALKVLDVIEGHAPPSAVFGKAVKRGIDVSFGWVFRWVVGHRADRSLVLGVPKSAPRFS
jgi:hypothetical protein